MLNGVSLFMGSLAAELASSLVLSTGKGIQRPWMWPFFINIFHFLHLRMLTLSYVFSTNRKNKSV
jgi:hypothetical protein